MGARKLSDSSSAGAPQKQSHEPQLTVVDVSEQVRVQVDIHQPADCDRIEQAIWRLGNTTLVALIRRVELERGLVSTALRELVDSGRVCHKYTPDPGSDCEGSDADWHDFDQFCLAEVGR